MWKEGDAICVKLTDAKRVKDAPKTGCWVWVPELDFPVRIVFDGQVVTCSNGEHYHISDVVELSADEVSKWEAEQLEKKIKTLDDYTLAELLKAAAKKAKIKE
jgi:hypothetical protein